MENNTINLLGENIKKLLNHPNNKKQLEYFLATFLTIDKASLHGKLKSYYNTILNTVTMTDDGIKSDLIIMFDDTAIKVRIYQTEDDECVIHILLGSLVEERGRLVELRYTSKNEYEDIVESFSLRNIDNPDDDLLKDLIKIKVIDLSRLKDLDNTTPQNRWIKFIGAQTNEERLEAAREDEYLMELYIWLMNN